MVSLFYWIKRLIDNAIGIYGAAFAIIGSFFLADYIAISALSYLPIYPQERIYEFILKVVIFFSFWIFAYRYMARKLREKGYE